MLDIKFIRENQGLVQDAIKNKKVDCDLDRLLAVDQRRLELTAAVEAGRARQNEASKQVVSIDQAERAALIAEMQTLKESLKTSEEELPKVMKEWQLLMLAVPNLPDMSVPIGDESANREIKTWGEVPQFDFPVRGHVELLELLDLADLERGTKLSGFRGYVLKGQAALLNFALWRLAFDQLVPDGFEPMIVPSRLRREAFLGTGYWPQGAEDLYQTQDGDFLSGTAEVPIMSYYADEILEPGSLPRRYVGFSPCFRREAGSHGQDTKGLMRVHEFYKVEQVVLCEASHEASVKWHEQLLANAERLLQTLELPYRVIINATTDLGLGQVKKYDLEAWVPSENKYRETHSISYFHDFQTRRLNLRYRDPEGKLRFAHSLNGTAVATPRLLVPLLEVYQQADGTVRVPTVLQPYLGGLKLLAR